MIHAMLRILLAQSLLLSAALAASKITHPGIDFKSVGGSIALFGNYDALSFYNYANDSSFVGSSSSNSSYLYLRNSSTGSSQKIATLTGGSVSSLQQLNDESVLVSGSFSSLNGEDYQPPVIYNVTSDDFYSLFSTKREDYNVEGNVLTTFVDNDLIYLGGDFQFNDTTGAAVYNITSRSLRSLPFQGFGDNATVNAITKLSANSNDDSDASIVFGGSFHSLGLPELLTHNISHSYKHHNSSNSTNTTFISAEQMVSLKHATFSSVNGISSNQDSSVICPQSSGTWSLQDNSGGQWSVQLPLEMQGIVPTKVRIYVPENSQDGIKTFRIYSYPNNGIMNLTYIDPNTNELAYCDAACPLQLGSTLSSSTQSNIDEEDSYLDEDSVYVDKDGSFFMYYMDTKTRNLGYGKNYQEFALINSISSERIGLTATSWYGSKAEFSGFEMYSNSIAVYGNDTLNESNCGSESNQDSNSAVINSGNWQPVTEVSDITSNNYIVSSGNGSSITLYPNISYAGDYSLLFYTPGCSADNSCSKRSIVNVSVFDTDNNTVSSVQIHQNNLEDKFDYLFYGHLNGSSEEKGRNRVTIDFDSAIDSSVNEPWVVVDKVVANIVSLDNYNSKNSSNSTSSSNRKNFTLTNTKLNGLFEYSLANFSSFDLNQVYESEGDNKIIKSTNTYVGSSSINMLSGELSKSSVVKQVTYNSVSKQLLLLGEFESSNLTISNNNLLTLKISDYNTTSNETISSLQTRTLLKRADFQGLSFNNSITSIMNVENGFVALGQFSATGEDIKDLSNDNSTASSANNFALNAGGEWYSFGNSYRDDDYSQFASIVLDETEYFIFSTSDGDFQAWDNTNKRWSTSKNNMDITASVDLGKRDQQIIGGPSFGTMQFFEKDQAFFSNASSFDAYDLQVMNGSITNSFFVNSSLSVIGGKFQDNTTMQNIALVRNKKATSLDSNMLWGNDTFVTSLYVDSKAENLFIGSNGSVSISGSDTTGLVIYNLQNGSFTSVQPADLSNSDGSAISVNALAFNDDSQQLLVGGKFDNAGSLSCSSLCFFDIAATRWTSPMTGSDSTTIEGEVTDAKFLDSNAVLVSGNLTLNGTSSAFVVYDFSSGTFASAGNSINEIGDNGYITRFIINQEAKGQVNNKMAALTNQSVIAYNTSSWARIDGSIEYSEETQLLDLKLIKLSKSSSSNPSQEYFSNDNVLMLSGRFNLSNYGLVNTAMYDGSAWIPYVFATEGSYAGSIYSTLFEDVYRYQSSDDLKSSSHKMTTGQVVGVSFACALGSTALLGLLFIIPFFFLFKRKKAQLNRRTHEDEMLNAVNPGDLFHEMDAQRKM